MSNNIRVINFKKEEKIAVLIDGQEIFKGDYEDHQTAISITRVIGYHNFYPKALRQRLNESKRL